MDIVVPFKVVADDQNIAVAADGSLDFSKAHSVVSSYDKNALEAASRLAAASGDSSVKAITVGARNIDDSKMKKDVLARGADELLMTADDACADLDAFATAAELVKLLGKAGHYDLVICGDGSADLYAKQTGPQLAAALGVPYVSAVVSIEVTEHGVVCKRLLESEIETVEVPLPAVISVTPDIAPSRICGMKDILAAGKKPQAVGESEGDVVRAVETVSIEAPKAVERKLEILDASNSGDIEKFAAAIKAAL